MNRREFIALLAGAAAAWPLAAKAQQPPMPVVGVLHGGWGLHHGSPDVTADDPVRLGLVASFNRPGGNATGVYFLIAALEAKRAEVVHELVPKATTIAVLVDPNFPSAETQSREMEEAARSLGLKLLVLKTGSERDFDTAFATLVRERAGALVVAASGLFFFRRGQLITLAARHAVPTVYPWREAAADGGLMSYGTSRLIQSDCRV